MRIVKTLAAAAAVTLLISCGLVQYEKKLKSTTVEDIHLSDVENGVYQGEYDLGLASAAVRIVVKDGRIQELVLEEHLHSEGYGADEMAEKIFNAQRLKVDAVTGATGSSIAIVKAVELALKEGVKND